MAAVTTSSSTGTVGPSLAPTATPPARYVPPHLRKKREGEGQSGAVAERPGAATGTSPSDSDHRRGGGELRFGLRRDQQQRGTSSPVVVADRWKGLDAASENTSFGRPTRADGGGAGQDFRGGRMTSTTGTGWDVRDGRVWRPEQAPEVFSVEHERPTTAGINFDSYDSIPVEVSGTGSEALQPLKSFKETAGVHPLLHQNIIRVDYERPTPVQKYSIPVILSGRDLMACAQTGSGKTAAFLFPIITKMLHTGPPCPGPRIHGKQPAYPVSLVLSPTRELAVQICKEARKFAFGTGIKTVVVYGGSEVRMQLQSLKSGCDICVATPGRLSEFTMRGVVRLDLVNYFVLDEADRMLDMGFAPQIYSIVEELPSEGRQTVMFSATFPNQIQKLAAEFLRDYIFLTVGRVGSTNEFITQQFVYANETSKPKRLLNVLEENKGGLILVFVETKKKADLIEMFLRDSGLPAVSLHGDKCQEDREEALHLFRTGRHPILVATDVAARGLDIHNIAHVINCDLPSRIEDYVHRIGRTGRAGNRGKATSFVNEQNKPVLRDLLCLLEEAQQEIPSWFYELVKSCTSAYRNGFSSVTTMFGGKSSAARTGSRPGFGGRDVRSGGIGATMSSATAATPQRSTMMSSSRATGGRGGGHHEEEEDGW